MNLSVSDPSENLSRIIGSIYDTVIDPRTWAEVLQDIGEFASAARITLILEDSNQPTRSAHFTSFDDPEWLLAYIERYLLINPMRLALEPYAKPGDVLLTTDFTTPEEYAASRIAREFLAPCGLVDIASAILEKTGATITVLALKRDVSQGFADELLRRRAALLLPHVRRATSISRALEQQAGRLTAFAETFDKLEATIFLLDAQGRSVERNSSATRMLAGGGPLTTLDGRLRLRDGAANAEFDRALRLAGAGESLGGAGAALALKANEGLYSAPLMPLNGGDKTRRLAGPQAVALFCVREVQFAPAHAMSNVSTLFALTRRESAVLMAISELGGAPEAAAALGLSESTVKSHLKALFRKTRTTRQSELVRLVGSAGLPVK